MPKIPVVTKPLESEQLNALFSPLSSFWCLCRNKDLNINLIVYSHLVIPDPQLTVHSSLKNPEDKVYTLFLPESYREDESINDDLGLSVILEVILEFQKVASLLPPDIDKGLVLDACTYNAQSNRYSRNSIH